MEDLNLKKLHKIGFKTIKKGAAHCLLSPEKKEILHSYSWSEYCKKVESFLR